VVDPALDAFQRNRLDLEQQTELWLGLSA
jgi:hypothetical protein